MSSPNFSLKRQYAHYAIPSIVAMWVFSIYTMVDGFFVSNYVGNTALSAVNLAMPLVNTTFALAIIFAVGTSTTIGILLGQQNEEKACEVFSLTTVFLLTFAIIIAGAILLNLNGITRVLGAEGETFPLVKEYLFYVIWFTPFFMVSYHFEILVKIDGFPTLATWGVITSALTNIFLDYLFVGVFHMGIKGAAIATGIAQVVSTLVFLFHFLKGPSRLVFKNFSLKLKALMKILPLGLGDFLSEFSTGFIVFLYNRFLLITLGQSAIISYTVVSYLNLLVAMTMVGLTQGMQPLMSYYLGKEDRASCQKLFTYAVVSIGLLSLGAITFTNLFSQGIVNIFIHNNQILEDATVISLRKFTVSFLFLGFNLMLIGFFASIGKAKSAIILSLSRGFVLIYMALQFSYIFLDSSLIWYSSAFSEALALFIGIGFLIKVRNNTISHL